MIGLEIIKKSTILKRSPGWRWHRSSGAFGHFKNAEKEEEERAKRKRKGEKEKKGEGEIFLFEQVVASSHGWGVLLWCDGR